MKKRIGAAQVRYGRANWNELANVPLTEPWKSADILVMRKVQELYTKLQYNRELTRHKAFVKDRKRLYQAGEISKAVYQRQRAESEAQLTNYADSYGLALRKAALWKGHLETKTSQPLVAYKAALLWRIGDTNRVYKYPSGKEDPKRAAWLSGMLAMLQEQAKDLTEWAEL